MVATAEKPTPDRRLLQSSPERWRRGNPATHAPSRIAHRTNGIESTPRPPREEHTRVNRNSTSGPRVAIPAYKLPDYDGRSNLRRNKKKTMERGTNKKKEGDDRRRIRTEGYLGRAGGVEEQRGSAVIHLRTAWQGLGGDVPSSVACPGQCAASSVSSPGPSSLSEHPPLSRARGASPFHNAGEEHVDNAVTLATSLVRVRASFSTHGLGALSIGDTVQHEKRSINCCNVER